MTPHIKLSVASVELPNGMAFEQDADAALRHDRRAGSRRTR
jgi:hypothetical protein